MAIERLLGKIIPFSHLPTWFFIIGYPLFWIELRAHMAPHGVNSPLPWILWSGAALLSLGNGFISSLVTVKNKVMNPWLNTKFMGPFGKILWFTAFILAFWMLVLIVLAGLKPIHLLQESDCLQYHYTLPRQHLILGSFAHIPWAADDLFLLPMDFALAPFWFATELPNKFPQCIIFLGLIGVAGRLTAALAGDNRRWAGILIALVILGTHGFGIQMGTGMLDLAVVYLFLASLDSLRLGNWFLAGIEFTFFFWSKPLMPLEAVISMGIWLILWAGASWGHWQFVDVFVLKHRQKALGLFLILSVVVAGPFILKSIEYAGTPFYPMRPGLISTSGLIKAHPRAWQSLERASQYWMGQGTKNGYGHGFDAAAFIKHWWLLGVPEKGVNNAFDYPLGLTYLLMIGPFLFYFIKDIGKLKFSPLSVLAMVIWFLWWFGSQQSRFLYLPLVIIFMVTIARLEKISKAFILCLLISLSFEVVSTWDAHKKDMGRWGFNVLRPKDQDMVLLGRRYIQEGKSNYIDWPSHDAAYAQFPVMVHKEMLPHTILAD